MNRYIVVEQQSGGCDYTIGCGTRVSLVEADSMKHALQVFVEKHYEEYVSGDADATYLIPGVAEYAPDSVEIWSSARPICSML